MDFVKVCGLKKTEEIDICAEYGANAIGFIYNVPSSPRNLEKQQIITLIKHKPKKIKSVIIFKAKSVDEVKDTLSDISADLYQIHCSFNIHDLDEFPPTIKKKMIIALKVDSVNKDSVIKQINHSFNQFYAFLLDNSEGHGTYFNYNIVLEILRMTYGSNIILAGGIDINNVEYYIRVLKPFGIDASSSLESEKGVKDPLKIIQFLEKINEIKKHM